MLTEDRIEELENGLKEILKLNNLESIKEIAADLVGEDPEDWLEYEVEEDFYSGEEFLYDE